MLQQTQVATVLPYYEKWLARFPDLNALTAASEDEALAEWQGLGYYRRCRMLLQGAKWVKEHGWPSSAEEWRQVPGVGRYTAGAIASISLGERSAIVDANVRRVVARLTASSLTGTTLERHAWNWAETHLPRIDVDLWNQALMELGATVCRSANPACSACPLTRHCKAFRRGLQTELPAALAKPSLRMIEQWLWIPCDRERVGLRRLDGRWWRGMHSFLLTEKCSPPVEGSAGLQLPTLRHVVTRHRVTLHCRRIEPAAVDHLDITWIPHTQVGKFGIPAPHLKAYRNAVDSL
jgi:A/G-specific adenine glycosylase